MQFIKTVVFLLSLLGSVLLIGFFANRINQHN